MMFGVGRLRFALRCSSSFLMEFQIHRKCVIVGSQNKCQHFHTNRLLLKKRLSEEEKAFKNTGRKMIRYSPKGKPKNPVIDIWKNMTVQEVAIAANRKIDDIFESMLYVNNADSYSEETSIIDNPQVIQDILKICGYRFRTISKIDDSIIIEKEIIDAVRNLPAPPENLKPRPPVVTVMGHVDHGKTTLLDALRNSNVVEQEFGGITQHIGAFSVRLPNEDLVTFLDTPGHAAFSAMRARGANVTDMVVLVVAADDGVMEQTIESIRMAREAKVPMIVAINKIDKIGADIERTKKMLSKQGIIVEDLGGDVQSVPISALKHTNLDLLIETIGLQAQLMELKSDPTGLVEGVIIEAQTDPQRGKLATIIVQRGTLRRGCIVVAGMGWARTRTMFSPDGSPISEAPPSTPVQLLGWRELPSAGDDMIEVQSEKRASEVLRWRHNVKMQEKQEKDAKVIAIKESEHKLTYGEHLQKKRLLGRFKLRREGPRPKMFIDCNEPTLSIVVKADVDGSLEAILDVLETYDDHSKCKLDIVHYGVGNISETDIEMAEAFKGLVYAFNVDCLFSVRALLKEKNMKIKNHNVIYKMIDDIKEEINNRIPSAQKEEELGVANVLQNFSINERRKVLNVAGCRCIRGVLKRNAMFKVLRGEELLFDGKLASMRHIKDEVDTIKNSIECGLRITDKGIEFKPGDMIVCYHMVDYKKTTEWNPGF